MSPHEGEHLDPEVLALISLGERPGTPEDRARYERHLASCGHCSTELDELSSVARTARTLGPEDALVAPPPEVWEAVAREVSAEAPASVVALAERRRRAWRWAPLAAAACAGLLVGAAATYAVTADRDATAPAPTVLASTVLDPLGGSTARGRVEVVQGPSGPMVSVDVTGLAAPSAGFYEVWLLDRSGNRLVALGALDSADKGMFAMPPGVSMSEYPVVDVSLEPDDGNPGHSHDSLVRGVLPA